MTNGFNPMRWKCGDRGCYNVKQRPKIEVFAECFPGKIALTDIDATVEVNGYFLFMEFKSPPPRPIPMGQRIYFERLTALSKNITVVIICCDAETMECESVCTISGGKFTDWEPLNLEDIKRRVSAWANRAKLAKRA